MNKEAMSLKERKKRYVVGFGKRRGEGRNDVYYNLKIKVGKTWFWLLEEEEDN